MSRIRRTTLGNLALLVFVAFLFQVLSALASPTSVSAQTATSVVVKEGPQLPEEATSITIKLQLSPLTPPQWESVLVKLAVYHQDRVFTISGSVYQLVYEQVYVTVYDTVYDPQTGEEGLLLGLTYMLPQGVALVKGDSIVLSVYADNSPIFTRTWPVPTPPPEYPPVVTVPVPTTVPTDTGVVRIDPARDEAVLRVDPAKVEAQLKDPKVTEVRLSIPPTVDTATMAVDIPPAVLTGSETYGKPLVAELGAAGQVELQPGTVTADDLKYKDERGVERQGNLRIAASRLSQDEAAPLLAKLDRSWFGNQHPVAQVYEVEAQVVADGKVVGTARPKKPLLLVLTFDKGKVDASGAPIETTMIYVWNEVAQTWDPCATKVDPASGKVTTKRPKLSKYTVMAYRRTFADIARHWAQRDIEIMAGRLVARGVTPTTFLPDGKVTRAQFVAFLQRALGIPEEKPAQPTFSDVAPDAWYYGAVEGAAKAGLVLGWQGKFRPDDLVTREEMATMVVRGIDYDGKKVTLTASEVDELLARFIDRGSISDWARENAAIAVKAGIVLGRKVDSEPPVYAPKDDALRAEAVTMIKRLLKYLGWFGQP